jgi:protease I
MAGWVDPGIPTALEEVMQSIEGKRIAILATNGFEQSELEVPLEKLRAAGAEVHVVSPEAGEIRGWEGKDWGRQVSVDATLSEVSVSDYDALVLPGGQINPDLLRVEPKAIAFVKEFWAAGKVIGAICHAPWLLIEAGIVRGRNLTSYASIKTDVKNAGGLWTDAEVVTDKGLVTSRKPEDLPAFCAKLVEEIAEGTHQRVAA